LQSNPALLTLNSGPNTVQDPADTAYCIGQPLAFSGGPIPNGTQVQWEFSNDGGSSFFAVSNGAQYSGANTSTLTVLNPTDQITQQHQLRVPTVTDPTALRALELKPNMFPHMM
jgi:hypothetical protein